MFSCEFCEISKNIFFTEHLLVTASYYKKIKIKYTTILFLNKWDWLKRLDFNILTHLHSNTKIFKKTFFVKQLRWLLLNVYAQENNPLPHFRTFSSSPFLPLGLRT